MKKGISKGQQMFKNEGKIIKKTYQESFEEYIDTAKIRGLSEDTIRTYYHHHKYFTEFIGKNKNCGDLDVKTVESYILYLQEKDIKKTTINSYVQNISPIIKYCIKKEYILNDFLIPIVKTQEEFKEILTEDELNVLLQPPKGKDFVSIRVYSCVWLLASTGLRASELRNLKIKNVNMLDRVITCNYTKNKKVRYLPISSSLYGVLDNYLVLRNGEGDDYLFPTVYGEILSRTSLQKGIVKYCHERGIQKSGIHIYRHTFITRSVERNVSPLILKNIIGHSSFKQLNHYYNAKVSSMVDVIDSIAPKLNKKESFVKKKGK
ncbi:tyrosine-type recombinase/integrase [Clostridium tagluense]|uniref:tyrosine-type recombinase/integrase n=1 Tax=Clostridium tagluense TaxID=360422 RepID=UPI001CF4C5E3|nr:tyrosine-type recombinase/integrase [Clostridium tagluense]MCB2312284.1 tyrosine-type recombinase/integrase [Clostridium tagluense]MCB2316978.1 tyrosine-type recombinase/integrase [Clostridium tagluense]MCB2321822.1 tyrosine-type recombinase/integrase [Clostridium tagluense]MCB2326757.1 tyrosine-type recombinase/integrase [Clostridium tagluense]MCB2331570.1 tyrosine-type recombinase/integrase [Clostridium tagluense]